MQRGDPWDQLFDSDSDRSLEDADEHDQIVKAHKKKDVKLNNSFTGPYPSDPTDFNHTDKGANAQFAYYNKISGTAEAVEIESVEIKSAAAIS